MTRVLTAIAVLFVGVSLAAASDIDVRVTDPDGNAKVTVNKGEKVDYKVTAVLTDSENEGLALIGFNLSFSGGDLEPADTPSENPMLNFARNEGIDNPEGYGGTLIDGVLHQIGGGQNTIKNPRDPGDPEFPVGDVIVGVAQADQVVVTGSLTAPGECGEYNLLIEEVFANVIKKDETGNPFWHTEPAPPGNIENMTITVEGCEPECPKRAKVKGKYRKDDVKTTLSKHEANTKYTAQLFADGEVVATAEVTTNNKGKAKIKFKDVDCDQQHDVGVEQCGSKAKVKKTCK